MKYQIWIVLALGLLSGGRAAAEVKLNALFSDNAVLQQNMPVPVWGTASEGEQVTVQFAGQTAKTTAKEGSWMVKLNPLKASATPQTLTVSGSNSIKVKNVLVGEVWICSGQSNMEFPLANLGEWRNGVIHGEQFISSANDPQLRLLTVKRGGSEAPQSDLEASWSECTSATAGDFSAVGYFFGRDLRSALNVPVGLISSNVGGTAAELWTSREALKGVDAVLGGTIAAQPQIMNKRGILKGPSTLYNAMIAPLQPFAIAGVIWYQGENNAGQAQEYQTLFPALIADWRSKWGAGDFPFLFVQIAPYKDKGPEIREAQLLSWAKSPRTAMVVTTDCGEAENIHPQDKEPVGARLALAARAIAYGEKLEYSGPVFESLKVTGSHAELSFTHLGGGLVARGGELKGFAIAGADKNFVPATAKIEGDKVLVNSAEVPRPVAVRYGWANVPEVNLFNKADLPATPFRTDVELKLSQQPQRQAAAPEGSSDKKWNFGLRRALYPAQSMSTLFPYILVGTVPLLAPLAGLDDKI